MKLGFIGTGNMAGAIMGGIIKEGIISPDEIIGADILEAGRERVRKEHGIHVTEDNREAAGKSEVLVLSVKPQYYEQAISEIRDCIREEQIIVTLAPGKTLSWLEEKFGKPVKIVRTMPNTPALVGEGMTAACPNQYVTDQEKEYVLRILGAFGKVEVVPEHLIDAVVAEGMPRAQAYEFAAQAVYGSAKMVLETGKHPGELKDMVCSPSGTTIEAVRVLEKEGFRSAVIEAMKACADVSRNL